MLSQENTKSAAQDEGPALENPVSVDDAENDASTQPKKKGLKIGQVVGSVFAAGLGVQSSKNRERDFQEGRAITFIVAGLVFTALFIGTLYAVVTAVLSTR